MFDHLANCEYGIDLLCKYNFTYRILSQVFERDISCANWMFFSFLVDEVQVASYKILQALYTLGTDPNLTHDRKYLKTELERCRSVMGKFSAGHILGAVLLFSIRCYYHF